MPLEHDRSESASESAEVYLELAYRTYSGEAHGLERARSSATAAWEMDPRVRRHGESLVHPTAADEGLHRAGARGHQDAM